MSVRSSDPTYYADPGQTLEQAAASAVAVRLPWFVFGEVGAKRRVAVKPGETAAELAERFDRDALAEATGKGRAS